METKLNNEAMPFNCPDNWGCIVIDLNKKNDRAYCKSVYETMSANRNSTVILIDSGYNNEQGGTTVYNDEEGIVTFHHLYISSRGLVKHSHAFYSTGGYSYSSKTYQLTEI